MLADVALHTETRGVGPRLVLLHGFTQNTRCWGPFADHLAADHELVLVDTPGHGRSGHDDSDLVTAGHLVADAGGAAPYLGYSMGGRILLHAALHRPEAVRAMVLIGATAGIDDPAGREARRAEDDVLAGTVERVGVESFVEGWLNGPLFGHLDPSVTLPHERSANRAGGLASSLRRRGTGVQASLWDDLGAVTVPTLVVVGQHDARFVPVARRLVGALGGPADLAVVPGVGHAVHLERPDEVAGLVSSWLDDLRPGADRRPP